MHIAYVCCDPGVPVFGCKGCSIHVQEVLREFVRQGHKVSLFAVRLGGDCPPDLMNVRVRLVEYPSSDNAEDRERSLFALNQTVEQALRAEGPFQLVYERHSLFSFAAMEYARKWFIPGILEVNSPLVREQSEYRVLINRELAERTTRRVMTVAGAVLAVSEPVAEYVKTQRLNQKGIYVVPNGVDLSRFAQDPSPAFPRMQDEFTIGFVGTLKPWHGVSELLKAFALTLSKIPRARLLIVGDGPERERLELQAAQLLGENCDKVMFTGAVQARDIPAYLQKMDVGVAPYPADENAYFSPLKVFEYMAASLPIVASNVGQIAELIVNSESGYLVPPGNAQALSEILVMLAQDPAQCRELGANAKALVQSRFTWSSVVARILQMAQELNRRHAPKVGLNVVRPVAPSP